MAQFGEEFDDSLLDDLQLDDLNALEQSAFQATQAPGTQLVPEVGNRELQPYSVSQFASQSAYGQLENGDDEDEIIDTSRTGYEALAAHSANPVFRTASTQRDQRGLPAAAYAHLPVTSHQAAQTVLPHRPASQIELQTDVHGAIDNENVRAHGPGDEDLRAQVQALLLERQQLQTTLAEAQKQVQTKTGEIAIVRSNHEKNAQERERKLAELQQQVHAANERHKTELEQARRQQEQLTTESRFADHDKVLDRARRRKPVTKPDEDVIIRPAARLTTKALTPRRNRHASPGHGADADERSPAKSQSHSRTPRAAERKRKRLPESPIKPLVMYDDDEMLLEDEVPIYVEEEPPNLGPYAQTTAIKPEQSDRRYKILQQFLNRRLEPGGKRTTENLAEHKFPSDAENALSTIIFDEIAKLESKIENASYASALCGIVIGLWTRCLTEKYYQPLLHLLDIISYMLGQHPDAMPSILDDLVPVLQKTADINLIPRFKRALRKQAGDPGTESEHVNSSECLTLLLQIVMLCRNNSALMTRFWTFIRVDFLSMLMRPVQDVDDIILTCRILIYGLRSDGFGPVLGDTDSQPTNGGFSKTRAEDHLVDRMSALLIEQPRDPTGLRSYNQAEVARMRLEVLCVIEQFTTFEYCALVFVRQRYAVGRLVRCMNDEFHEAMGLLYGWQDRIQVVNEATRLLFHFVYRYSVDINDKMQAIPGGAYKYLIILTRLIFSDNGIWGSEVDEDVVDCAQELLEDHVNPEEGDALMAAFNSGPSKR